MEDWVYIIKSQKNGRYYIGSTKDPIRRLNGFHNQGKVKATKYLIPWELVFSQKYTDVIEAKRVEWKLKRLKSRVILEKIINSGRCNVKIGYPPIDQ